MNHISTALTRNDVRYALAVGILMGGASGYFIARKTLATKFEAIANEEIESVKEHYHKQAMLKKEGVYSDPANLVENPVKEEPEPNEYTKTVTELEYVSDGDTVKETVVDAPEGHIHREEVIVNNVFTSPRPTEPRNKALPYVITVEEYMNGDAEQESLTLTYFEGDHTLVDENEEPIADIPGNIGEDALSSFGMNSDDPDIVYVRNTRIGADFEVVRDPGHYSEKVLGIVREPRSRDSDDERDD